MGGKGQAGGSVQYSVFSIQWTVVTLVPVCQTSEAKWSPLFGSRLRSFGMGASHACNLCSTWPLEVKYLTVTAQLVLGSGGTGTSKMADCPAGMSPSAAEKRAVSGFDLHPGRLAHSCSLSLK